jgi:hypothetical protein
MWSKEVKGRQRIRCKHLLDGEKGVGKKCREDKEEDLSAYWMMGNGKTRKET